MGIVLTLYLSSAHRTRTETIIRHGKKIKGTVPISGTLAVAGRHRPGVLRARIRRATAPQAHPGGLLVLHSGFSFTLIFAPLGFALILLGAWLLLRAYRIQKFGTANAKMAAKEARGSTTAERAQEGRRNDLVTPAAYKPPTANKRYTPKAPPRKKVAKPTEKVAKPVE